ncbi:MAG: hypothetical protein ABS948_00645 [Solibacillus sp.]
MRLTEKNRRYILVGMVAFIIVGIFTAKMLGSKQDEQFAYEDMLYAQANQMYQDGNYIDATVMIIELLELQPKSESANYLGAMIAANTGEYKQSAILLQKTMDLNPYNVEKPMFILQLGEILLLAERYEDAKIVLERCRDWGGIPAEYPDYQEHVAQLLLEVEQKLQL